MDGPKVRASVESTRSPGRWLWALLLVFACLAAYGSYAWGWFERRSHDNEVLGQYQKLPGLVPDDSLTIVSPHLDDETIGLGGLIAQARRQNVKVSVIFMTNGDDNPVGANLEFDTGYATPEKLIELGRLRQDEALKALAGLGVAEGDVYFLGLPDRGLRELASSKYQDTAYLAPGTLRTSSPYERSFQPGLDYTGTAARAALAKAINLTKPTQLFTTMPEDRHSDHSATAKLVSDVMPDLVPGPKPYYFLVHYPGFPRPRGVNHEAALLPPKRLVAKDWKAIPLTPDDVEKKSEAIETYRSQLQIPFLGGLMRGMVRSNEVVSE